jgi:hypothetical protein
MLKHSYLHLYPSIESCLVALCAYTCYFFSNGLSMSGIVSLLFCGITLKHYAYHTMSRRTQRATKYIFSTLAQLSENFIFVYLGMSCLQVHRSPNPCLIMSNRCSSPSPQSPSSSRAMPPYFHYRRASTFSTNTFEGKGTRSCLILTR